MAFDDLSADRVEDARKLIDRNELPETFLEEYPVFDPEFQIQQGYVYQGINPIRKFENFTVIDLNDQLPPGSYQIRIPSTNRPFVIVPVKVFSKARPEQTQASISQADRDELIGLRIRKELMEKQIADLEKRNEKLETEIESVKKSVPELNVAQTIMNSMAESQKIFASQVGSATGGDSLVKQFQAGMQEARKNADQTIKALEKQIETLQDEIKELENEIDDLKDQNDELKEDLRGQPKQDSMIDKVMDIGVKFMGQQQNPAPDKQVQQPKQVQQLPEPAQKPEPQKPQPEMSAQNKILNSAVRFLNRTSDQDTEAVYITDVLNSPSGIMIKSAMMKFTPEQITGYVIDELRSAGALKAEVTDDQVFPVLNELSTAVKGLI